MCTSGISRNIPASHRSLILDRVSEASKWPGERKINAVVTQGKLRVSYSGQGGYACLRIDPEDDIDRRLVAIDRLIAHEREVTLIRASLLQMRMECDYDPVSKLCTDDDNIERDMPLWTWSVPEEMASAYQADSPAGVRAWIDQEFEGMKKHLSYNPGTKTFDNTAVSLRAEGWGQVEGRCGSIELFSVKNAQGILSWNTKNRYLKLNTIVPEAVVASLEGKSIGNMVDHPLIHPETVIRRAKKDKDCLLIEMWRQASVLMEAPVRTLAEVNAIDAEYRRIS